MSTAPTRLHWTRIALLAGVALAVVGTCLPWLVGVPSRILSIGSGTILGITTVHGAIVGCFLKRN